MLLNSIEAYCFALKNSGLRRWLSRAGLFVSTLCDLIDILNDVLLGVGRIDGECTRKRVEAAVNVAQSHVLDLEADARVHCIDRVIVGDGRRCEDETYEGGDGSSGNDGSHEEKSPACRMRVLGKRGASAGEPAESSRSAMAILVTERLLRKLWLSRALALRIRASCRVAAGTECVEHTRLGRLRISGQDFREHCDVVCPCGEDLGALVNLVRVNLVERVAFGVMGFPVFSLVLDDGKRGDAVREKRQVVGAHHVSRAQVFEADTFLERLDDFIHYFEQVVAVLQADTLDSAGSHVVDEHTGYLGHFFLVRLHVGSRAVQSLFLA